ncbi:hypothetical protein B4U80_06952, partial [Leptotrombidium deliense]
MEENDNIYTVEGIISFGTSSDKCGTDSFSVYARVTSYVAWILENTSDASYCDN